jgi:hypothetical protein
MYGTFFKSLSRAQRGCSVTTAVTIAVCEENASPVLFFQLPIIPGRKAVAMLFIGARYVQAEFAMYFITVTRLDSMKYIWPRVNKILRKTSVYICILAGNGGG